MFGGCYRGGDLMAHGFHYYGMSITMGLLLAFAAAAAEPAAKARPFSVEGMVWIAPATFDMGWNDGETDERPVHKVSLDGFWIDKFEVTNEQFARFVEKSGYVTIAEKPPDPKLFPGVPAADLKAGSIVFTPPKDAIPIAELRAHNAFLQWWRYVAGASWRHPEGPGSTLRGREKHPVVHIAWDDAVAFSKWAGKSLPTEAQWEYAARGGLAGKEYVWGDQFEPKGRPMANLWQGQFPVENTARDGFRGTAPVGSFQANGFGLHDMAGNAWEWCHDFYLPNYYKNSPAKNPPGPDSSHDPNEPGVAKRVQRGGSFLCTDLYCGAFRPSRRMKTSPDTGLSHAGFRCVAAGFAPAAATDPKSK